MSSEAAQLLDLNEHGLDPDDRPQTSDSDLFMQLLVLEAAPDRKIGRCTSSLLQVLKRKRIPAVAYESLNRPDCVGLLSWNEDPTQFLSRLRPVLAKREGHGLRALPQFSMVGRTYSTGREDDLEDWLRHRPVRAVLDRDWPWAVWYPLRRSGTFERLDEPTRTQVYQDHARVGSDYAEAGLVRDIHLRCVGLDENDNDLLVGLIGRDLRPLSQLVQSMRVTRHTSEFVTRMGPFFVGRAVWRQSDA